MTLVRHTVMLAAVLASTQLHADSQWSDDLLGLAGTSVVFDTPAVQQALHNGQTPDLGNILQQAGMKPWAGARIWLVQLSNNVLQPFAVSQIMLNEASHRGLILNTDLTPDSRTLLQQVLSQAKINWNELSKLLTSQKSDALLVLSNKNNLYFWQMLSPPQRTSGTISQDGGKYLPHIWSENLAMAWQWPELGQDILIRIDGIRALNQFKAAETALASACTAVRVLHISPDSADFACRSTNNLIPDKLSLIPQLVAKSISSKDLSTEALMGRQLAQRFASYQWRSDIY